MSFRHEYRLLRFLSTCKGSRRVCLSSHCQKVRWRQVRQVFLRWNQLLTMMLGQLTGKSSLRSFITAPKLIQKEFYSLGLCRNVTCSNLSKANNTRDYRIFEEFAYHTMRVAQQKWITDIFKLERGGLRLGFYDS